MAIKRKIKNLIGLLLLALLLVSAAIGWQFYKKIYLPNVDTNNSEVFLYIATGSDENAVLDSLVAMKVLKNVDSYQWMAEKKNYG